MKHLSDINKIETNFRAEVVASALVDNGLAADKILFIRQQGDKKGVAKDIDRLRYQAEKEGVLEYLYIYTNRESIYDSLPEGLFHQTATSRRRTSKEEIIEEIKEQRGKEKTIRQYFQPFEMILDNLLIEAQSYEQKYDKVHFYSNLTNIINEHWDILRYLSMGQALLFIKIIPILPEASRSMELTADIISVILDCPVHIKEGGKSKRQLGPEDRVKLGDWRLGVTSVLGDTAEYASPDILIHLGPVNLEKMKRFESNRSDDLILKELISLMIPFDRNVQVRYHVNESETKFRLSGKDHTAYLGINTTL